MRDMREMRENFLLRWKILLLLLHVHTLVHTHDTLQFILYFIEDPQTTCCLKMFFFFYIHHSFIPSICHGKSNVCGTFVCTKVRVLMRRLE